MPSELITLEFLGSLAGLAVAVVLVVSFAKWLTGLTGRGAKLAAWVTALVLVGIVYANQGMFAVAGLTAVGTVVVMWLLNSMLVTWTAMKSYEDVVEPAARALHLKPTPAQPDTDPAAYLVRRTQHRG